MYHLFQSSKSKHAESESEEETGKSQSKKRKKKKPKPDIPCAPPPLKPEGRSPYNTDKTTSFVNIPTTLNLILFSYSFGIKTE